MALKAMLLRKQINDLNKELAEVRTKQEGFEAREKELQDAIEEVETEEQRDAVKEEIEAFEAEKKDTDEAAEKLEGQIADIERELSNEEEAQRESEPEKEPEQGEEREDDRNMETRRSFYGMNEMEQRTMLEREDVKNFLTEIRSHIQEKRAITGGGLIVPKVFLGLIRENIMEYSKLYKHVNVRQISGDGTAVVMGTIPEAVWTDCCANINELDLVFNDAEVACWKVGGYFDICNATLEDSEIDLAGEIVTVLGQAIGLALDKAILFGLGTRMPEGILTRLLQTSAPADYPATARPWVDLHTSNVKSIAASKKGAELIAEIVGAFGNAKGKYSRGEKVFVMNESTYTALAASTVTTDASGAIVTGVLDRMPVVGGIIEVLDFVPDDVIIAGFMDDYLLAERAGTRVDQSEHAMFLQDRTVFRGTARYDGLPVIAEAFVAIGINGTTPSADGITFAPDKANAASE